jgi:hypothetical protein
MDEELDLKTQIILNNYDQKGNVIKTPNFIEWVRDDAQDKPKETSY